jgi:segregation and condensation protein A
MGVTVTFAALLELLREGLIDIVQAEPYRPLHVRRAEHDPDAPAVDDVEITTA